MLIHTTSILASPRKKAFFRKVHCRKATILNRKDRSPAKDPGLCHDVTPWTHHNRVPLCQATLSIGPYLLLKVQFQRYFCFPNSSDFKPGAAHRKRGRVRDVYSRVGGNSWKVSSPALMPATTLETDETYRIGPGAGSPPNRRYLFVKRPGQPKDTPARCV